MEKILACITPQSNSQRLIDKAAESSDCELYILNVQKGDNIFSLENSAEMLEQLFAYGSKKGGTVHALAGDDVAALILEFIKEHEIMKVVVGEPPKTVGTSSIIQKIRDENKDIEIIILEREGEK